MKRSLLIFAVLIAIGTAGVQPAAAQNRYIVRTTGGLSSVLNLCSLLGCQVQGSLDGNINQTFLVTSSTNIVVNLRGRGLPRINSSTTGDLHVRLQLWTPENLSEEERGIIGRLSEVQSVPAPRPKGLWSKIRESLGA